MSTTDIVSLLLVAAALVFVGWPLFAARVGGDGDDESETRSPLERQKLEAYAAIKEAEFDRRMGKLSDADFAALEQRYRQQALAAISALERARLRPKPARAPRAGKRSGRFAYCPACGQPLAASGNFCGHCGHSLRDAVA